MDVSELAANPEVFKALPVEDQLAVLADVILHCATLEIQVLKDGYKERSVEFRTAHERKKYWENMNMNVKKIAELEISKLQRGI